MTKLPGLCGRPGAGDLPVAALMGAAGADVPGRSTTLKINYRTSQQIRAQADRLLDSQIADVDGAKALFHSSMVPAGHQNISVCRGRERCGLLRMESSRMRLRYLFGHMRKLTSREPPRNRQECRAAMQGAETQS